MNDKFKNKWEKVRWLAKEKWNKARECRIKQNKIEIGWKRKKNEKERKQNERNEKINMGTGNKKVRIKIEIRSLEGKKNSRNKRKVKKIK